MTMRLDPFDGTGGSSGVFELRRAEMDTAHAQLLHQYDEVTRARHQAEQQAAAIESTLVAPRIPGITQAQRRLSQHLRGTVIPQLAAIQFNLATVLNGMHDTVRDQAAGDSNNMIQIYSAGQTS